MSNPKILLVDDVDFFLDVERRFLAQTPAEILTAGSGREALEIAARQQPALVYMDAHMPEMDGLTCLRQLKADPRSRSLPVIMVLAADSGVTEDDCMVAGADGVLAKPLDRSAFLELGRRFLFHIDRREKRIPCQALVTLHHGGEEVHCTSEDLSARGAYLSCRHPVREGDMVTVAMVLPGGAATVLECRARIAWVNQGFPRQRLRLPQGFGIEFQEAGPPMEAALRKFVAMHGVEVETLPEESG